MFLSVSVFFQLFSVRSQVIQKLPSLWFYSTRPLKYINATGLFKVSVRLFLQAKRRKLRNFKEIEMTLQVNIIDEYQDSPVSIRSCEGEGMGGGDVPSGGL